MKEYRIGEILHSGSEGERGTKKCSPYDYERIDRTVMFDLFELRKLMAEEGWILLPYKHDKDGSNLFSKFMLITPIQSINWFDDKKKVVVETKNTIYNFYEVSKK